ncbi:hypothetical protein HZU75_15260 [Chitinibacter fontanus]|uniref:Uncharacterized protein n=1 Tax=Chitinibacter fontanus TaxID=1737446 RepID=A0A7D5ZJ81_9NEIS|nr:hypothetical protein [Chitinibacter fontanus]QLI82769.1 hypothetical protein HZU75_15260 [Chitinibacter fontanus]
MKILKQLEVVLLVLFLCIASNFLFAGITIHYSGQLKSLESRDGLILRSSAYAHSKGWRVQKVNAESLKSIESISAGLLKKIEGSNASGPYKGVVLYFHEMGEPLYLVTGEKLLLSNFVKTQFAGAESHRDVIQLFDEIKPFFESCKIYDESGYFNHRNMNDLQFEIDSINKQLEVIKLERPDAVGPVKLSSGRIADVISNK